jgi:N,N'-diacetyl-8-epilegionaminate cytidylyltransferase
MIDERSILALICARGGSKGVHKKNIRSLGGKPLVGWSIDIAKRCGAIDRIVVSTDDDEIAEIARAVGAEVPFMRPSELALDYSPEWLAWQHAIREIENIDGFRADYLVVLPPTSPFRSVEDLCKSISLIHESAADIVISVTASGRNPYFNMVELDGSGFASLCKRQDVRITRRQDAPRVYDITTVLYAAKTAYVKSASGVFDGKVKVVEIPEIRALDIDTELDLKFAEFLFNEGLAGTS